ncbi:phosphonate ABC transporter ATP-binding protein [Nitrosopumilus sp.]|uniref:phosphonate ABC transporter ATP-binding protein n=1 Tax=Nitrosopumilus sp. TaxID=2024843 RepID=UPI00292E16FD|nr:ATP-binding cassette domain-containing protein [Nitrosopumilus sp.]
MKLESMNETANNFSEMNIKLNGVSIEQSSKIILNNVNLEIKKGTMTAILGKSGAGKSTLLRTLAGLLKPSKNTLLINGMDFFSLGKKDKTNLRKAIGFIPQQFRLIKELSVFENVMIGRLGKLGTFASMLRIYPEQDRKIVLECINKVGLSGKERLAVRRLSGGEQQRVAIARCLAQEPQVILADEPVASLDVSLVETILEILDHENKKGKTIVFVMHDVELARRFSKRMMLMKNGQIISDKSSSDTSDEAIKSLFD